MPSFVLEIELGNAAMESPSDVGEALERLGARLAVRQWLDLDSTSGIVRDLNGNTVGRWEVRDDG